MTRLTQGLWRHRKCLDVDFYITKIQYADPTYYKVKVLYIYMNEGHPLIGGQVIYPTPETVQIQRQDLVNWERIL